jgi:hypothetical protein
MRQIALVNMDFSYVKHRIISAHIISYKEDKANLKFLQNKELYELSDCTKCG